MMSSPVENLVIRGQEMVAAEDCLLGFGLPDSGDLVDTQLCALERVLLEVNMEAVQETYNQLNEDSMSLQQYYVLGLSSCARALEAAVEPLSSLLVVVERSCSIFDVQSEISARLQGPLDQPG